MIYGIKYDEKWQMWSRNMTLHAVWCIIGTRRYTIVFFSILWKIWKSALKLQIKQELHGIRSSLIRGVGFGKTYEMNLEIIQKLEIMHEFKLPILLGTSRKSVIGLTLDLPADEREEGTACDNGLCGAETMCVCPCSWRREDKRAILWRRRSCGTWSVIRTVNRQAELSDWLLRFRIVKVKKELSYRKCTVRRKEDRKWKKIMMRSE